MTHHYDEIGLLEPGERDAAGYRVHSGDDLAPGLSRCVHDAITANADRAEA